MACFVIASMNGQKTDFGAKTLPPSAVPPTHIGTSYVNISLSDTFPYFNYGVSTCKGTTHYLVTFKVN